MTETRARGARRCLALFVVIGQTVSGCSDDGTTSPTTAPASSSSTIAVLNADDEGSPLRPAGSDDLDGVDPSPASAPTTIAPPSSTTAPDVLGPIGSTEVELETDEGIVQIGSGEVPSLVPTDFPVPDDLEVQLSSDAGASAGFSGVSQLGFDSLVGFYRDGLSELGYEVTQVRFVEGVVAVFAFSSPTEQGDVAISGAPGGGHSVLVTFELSG